MSKQKYDSRHLAEQPTNIGPHCDQSPAFFCARCGACCSHQAIQLNPWEVWRLARHLGLTSGQFIPEHSDNAGLFLRFKPDGRCGFLTPTGCAVHPARPLACRLYPLGLETDREGREMYAPLARHPACQGGASLALNGADRDAYLASQALEEWLAAQRFYLTLAREMEAGLAGLEPGDRRRAERELLGDGRAPGWWQDLDRAAGARLDNPREARERHAASLRAWLAGWQAGGHREDAYY